MTVKELVENYPDTTHFEILAELENGETVVLTHFEIFALNYNHRFKPIAIKDGIYKFENYRAIAEFLKELERKGYLLSKDSYYPAKEMDYTPTAIRGEWLWRKETLCVQLLGKEIIIFGDSELKESDKITMVREYFNETNYRVLAMQIKKFYEVTRLTEKVVVVTI